MNSKNTTITDVAREAGVSISTVSRVLNDSMPVSDNLRKKVQAAIEELNFQPNTLAQNLRRGSTATVGVISPSTTVPFFAEVVRGIEKECFRKGRLVYWCNLESDPEKEIIYTKQLLRAGVEGIILVGAFGWENEYHIQEACNKGIPVAIVNRDVLNCVVDLVVIDRTRGNFLATSHLIDLGHTDIACISILTPGGTSHEQLRGYRQALEEAGIPVREDLIVETSPAMETGYQVAKTLLKLENPPTAIFARSDQLAIGAASAAFELGLRIPEDLSLIGFGDITGAQFYNPPLTTIRQPQFDMGVKAATMLFERMQDSSLPQRQVIIDPTLVIRKSTARLAINGQ